MKKRVMLILSCLLLSVGLITAQTTRITGVVVDDNGEPVVSASVSVKGTTVGTVTDVDGKFSLNVPDSKNTLVFSLIGMLSVEVAVSQDMRVVMENDTKQLGEIVVMGYGSGRKLGTVVGSVVQVDATQIKDRPTANVFDALQGKVPGLQVYTNSGEPTSLSSIKLHGAGSLGGSTEPLFILDNAPVTASTVLNMSQNDFESVTVLKDASATSIYGSRASNGVIVITTKRGARGSKPVVTLKGQYGVSNLASKKFLDGFLSTSELLNFWRETGLQPTATIDNIEKQYGNVNFNWADYTYQKDAPVYEGSLSISGGADKINYYISANYLSQDGLAYRSGFDRSNLRSNIDASLSDNFKIGLNLNLGYNTRKANPDGGNALNGGISYLLQPFYSPYDENGLEYMDKPIPGVNFYSQKYRYEKFPYDENTVSFNGSTYIEYKPVRNLTFRSQHSMDAFDVKLDQQRLSSHAGALGNGYVLNRFQRKTNYTMTNTAEYKWSLDNERHQFSVLGGQEWIDYKNNYFSTTLYGYKDDRLTLLGVAKDNPEYGAGKEEYAYLSYFSRADYSLDNKYFLDLSLRNDLSSRFGKDNRSAWFWAVGGMWKIKKESFLESLEFLSGLDIKATYGTQGNSDIGNYESYALVGNSNYEGSGWILSNPGNPLLGWEKQAKLTVGINASFFKERLRIDLEGYNRVSSNMLVDVPYPYTTGYSSVTSNVGELVNRGFDLAVSFDFLKAKNHYLTGWANMNYNRNKVTKLFPGAVNDKYWIRSGYSITWAIDQPVSLYTPLFAGIDPVDGNPMWYVPGDDPTVTTKKETTKVLSDDLEQNTGATIDPPYIGGFGLTAGYKDFSLQVDFGWAIGKHIINNDGYFAKNPANFTSYNVNRDVLGNYWKQPGDIAKYPGTHVRVWTEFDDRLVENASFLRLKNINIGYNIPKKLIAKTKYISNLKFFVIGRNLFTVTKYTGKDPEVDSNLTYGGNPNTKQYSFGIELTF